MDNNVRFIRKQEIRKLQPAELSTNLYSYMQLMEEKMKTEQNKIGSYYRECMEKRIDYMYTHFDHFESMIQGYRDSLIMMIVNQKAYNRKGNHENMGIRVKTSGGLSNPTQNMAMDHMILGEYIDRSEITDELLEGVDNQEEIVLGVFELHLMKSEYRTLNGLIKAMTREDRKLLTAYLNKHMSLYEVADKLSIEPESAMKRLGRLRRNLKNRMMPFMRDYA